MERTILFSIFKKAIEDERKAYDFYMSAVGATSDPDLKKVFEELAETEISHEQTLQQRYKKLRELSSY